MTPRTTLSILITVLALTATACGGDDSSTDTYPETTSAYDDRAPVYPTTTVPDRTRDDYGFPGERGEATTTTAAPRTVDGRNDTAIDRHSTFGLDVDTGSYTLAVASLVAGRRLPDPDSVRAEEFVNAFPQDYPDPRAGEGFTLAVDGGNTPFVDRWTRVVRIGVRAEDVDARPPASLVFVIDTSGSMSQSNKLEMVQASLRLLTDRLDRGDMVAIVEFGNNASVVLEPTPAESQRTIVRSIDHLRPGGSTNFEDGLRLGYDLANEMFAPDAVNRVIVASDGVANVGLDDPDSLSRLIRRDADRGIDLITVGVGLGEYNDELLEQLADQGDGFYAYVNGRDEAERLFSDDLTGTLVTVAKDARIQVEFNPAAVLEWRLIGFENRAIADRDFRNDAVDAGELGAGHTVTALYEVELSDQALAQPMEVGRVDLRWLDPATGEPSEIGRSFSTSDLDARFEATALRFQQDVIVAQFAEALQGSRYAGVRRTSELVPYAQELGRRLRGDRSVEHFVEIVELAGGLDH